MYDARYPATSGPRSSTRVAARQPEQAQSATQGLEPVLGEANGQDQEQRCERAQKSASSTIRSLAAAFARPTAFMAIIVEPGLCAGTASARSTIVGRRVALRDFAATLARPFQGGVMLFVRSLAVAAAAMVLFVPAAGATVLYRLDAAMTVGEPYALPSQTVLREEEAGQIGEGTLMLIAPAGFEFDTSSTAVAVIADAKSGCRDSVALRLGPQRSTKQAVKPQPTTITFAVTQTSRGRCTGSIGLMGVVVNPIHAGSGELTIGGTSHVTDLPPGSSATGRRPMRRRSRCPGSPPPPLSRRVASRATHSSAARSTHGAATATVSS